MWLTSCAGYKVDVRSLYRGWGDSSNMMLIVEVMSFETEATFRKLLTYCVLGANCSTRTVGN